jgi:hypothetical protein
MYLLTKAPGGIRLRRRQRHRRRPWWQLHSFACATPGEEGIKGQRHDLLAVGTVSAPEHGLESRTETFERTATSRREVAGSRLRRRHLAVEGAQQGGGVFACGAR